MPRAVPRLAAPSAPAIASHGEGPRRCRCRSASRSTRVAAVLTDYHVHLRPDEPDTPPERYFTADNAARYRAAADAAGIAELGISEHVHRFRQALEVWRHPFWVETGRRRPRRLLRVPRLQRPAGRDRGRLRAPAPRSGSPSCSAARPFDYVIGSVHFVGDGRRRPGSAGTSGRSEGDDPDRIWARYFEQLAAAARSRPLRHPRPSRPGQGLGRRPPGARSATCAATTSPRSRRSPRPASPSRSRPPGLRKPVGELYPARGFAELCVEAGVPFTLSSDAHLPEHVGYAYDEALEFMRVARHRRRSACSTGASAGWSRSDERPGRDRLRQPPLRRRAGR